MNELTVFANANFGEIRMVSISDEPWFVLADVCKALELSTPAKVAERLDDDEKGMSLIHTLGGIQNMTIINESGLYSVILRSDKPQAKPFRKWVTSEVLPSIRKTGSYSLQRDSYMIDDPVERAKRWIAEEEERRKLQLTVAELTPKAEYFDELVDRNLLTNIRDTAKELKIQQKKFVDFLLEKKFLYRDSKKKLKPYSTHVENGLFEVKEFSQNKYASTQTLVTPKGKETFRLLIK